MHDQRKNPLNLGADQTGSGGTSRKCFFCFKHLVGGFIRGLVWLVFRLVCLFVCLFVCLLAGSRRNYWTDFHVTNPEIYFHFR